MNKLPLDVTRCQDDKCPKRQKCLRYLDTEEPHTLYWYASFKYNRKLKCDYFTPEQ